MKELRNAINKIDDDIVDLLVERKKIVKKIFEIKKKNKLPLIDKEREKEIILRAKKKAKSLDKAELEKIFKEVIVSSKK